MASREIDPWDLDLLFPEEYLHGDFARRYYRDLLALRRYDVLLAISSATKADCETVLGIPAHRVTSITSYRRRARRSR